MLINVSDVLSGISPLSYDIKICVISLGANKVLIALSSASLCLTKVLFLKANHELLKNFSCGTSLITGE